VVKAWKVILAALVIFAAGVVTGGLTVRLKVHNLPAPTSSLSVGPLRQRGELLDRMQRQLYLSATQREHIEKILRDSHERMKQLWDSIAPQAQEEHRRVHELIRAELQPEQQKRFEGMLTTRGPKGFSDDRRRREEWRDQRGPRRPEGTPAPASPGHQTPQP
jgi:hypothetical protein